MNAQLCMLVLSTVSELVLEVGERVLRKAEDSLGFVRPSRSENYGNVSVVIRMGLKQQLCGRVPLFRMISFVSMRSSGAIG